MSRHLECVAMFLFMDIFQLKFLTRSDHLLNTALVTLFMLFSPLWRFNFSGHQHQKKFMFHLVSPFYKKCLFQTFQKEVNKITHNAWWKKILFPFFTKSREIWNDSFISQSSSSTQMTDIIILANHMPWHTECALMF